MQRPRKGITGLFSTDGVSAVAGRAVLLPRGALSDDTVEEATSAGALAVLVDGPLPAGAFSLDVPAGVPVVGPRRRASSREIRALLAAGIPVTVAIGGVDVAERDGGGSIAAFSSRGLAFDGSAQARSRCARGLGARPPSRAAATTARSASGRSAGRAPRRR